MKARKFTMIKKDSIGKNAIYKKRAFGPIAGDSISIVNTYYSHRRY